MQAFGDWWRDLSATERPGARVPYGESVDLPVMPPMLAKTTTLKKALAMLPDVRLEPKWDARRQVVFNPRRT
jgi:hypothetical protein